MKKVALVTGGSRGIGKAICYALASDGYHVIVHYNNSKHEAEQIAKNIEGTAIQCDLSSTKNIDAFYSEITKSFKEIHCLIHNAGIADEDYLSNLTEQCFDDHININLKSPVFLTQKMKSITKDGSIIFISSGCATYPTPDALSYAISKAGIEIFAKSIYEEMAPEIRVNVVAAGATDTDMYQKNYNAADQEWVDNNNPMRGPRSPEEIANMVAFLASDKAGGVTGQVIRVNGGSHVA
jgi:3-oxoacyl-[acyl-carrier protein] reductase